MFDNIIIVQVVGKALKVFETVLRKQSFRNFVSLSKRHIFFFFFFFFKHLCRGTGTGNLWRDILLKKKRKGNEWRTKRVKKKRFFKNVKKGEEGRIVLIIKKQFF